MVPSVRNSMVKELTRENDSSDRRKEYFIQLLNGDEISEVDVSRARIGENEIVITEVVREEIMGVL